MLLLEVEEEVVVRIEQVRVELVHEGSGFLDLSRLDGIPDLDPLIKLLKLCRSLETSLDGEFLCSFFEAFYVDDKTSG